MLLIVGVQEWAETESSIEETEERKASSIMKGYLDLYGDRIMEAAHERFGLKVKTVEVETLLGLADGYARGVRRTLYCSPEWGIVKKLLLVFGGIKPTDSFKVRIGKRDIKVNVYL